MNFQSSQEKLLFYLQSLKCDSCDKEFHLHCLVATSGGRRDSSVCNACKTRILFYEVQEEDADDGGNKGGDKDADMDEDDTVWAVLVLHSPWETEIKYIKLA